MSQSAVFDDYVVPYSAYVENVDCRVGLKGLADNSVSLIMTDPPYFIDGMSNKWDSKALNSRIKRSKVIGGLPVGMKFDAKQSTDLLEFLEPIAREWKRVIKPAGFVLCFMQPRLAHAAGWAMDKAGIEIKDMYFWKRSGQAKAFTQEHFIKKRKDLSEEEKRRIIKKLGGRKTPQLRPVAEVIIMGQKPKEGTFVDNWLKWKTGLIDVSNPYLEPNKFPSTIMEAERAKDKYGHITPKPVDLLRHLIRIFCADSPDSLVLDPFAGCGSSGEAAILENRAFVGFEIDSLYAKIANNRIKKVIKNAR